MEEFNTYDLYLNQVKQDDVYNSKEYKLLKENNIDTAEIEGIDKDPDAGEIVFNKDQKLSDEENKIFLKDVTDFMLDIPRDTFISALRGGTNGLQFVNNFAGAIGLTEELFGPDATDQLNQKFEKIKSDLDNAQVDSPFVTKMIGMAGQDAMYTYPIYKKLQKAGIPKMWRLPLSFALGGALAFDKKESFFVDSNSMRNLKSFIGVAEDTPIEEMYDKAVQAIEFGAFGKIFDDVLGLAKSYKTMNKDRIKQADIALGGSAGSAAVVEQFVDDPNQASTDTMPNIEPSEEKKNPNFNDDEIIPGTVNEYGFEKTSSLVPVFKSILKETAKKLPNKGSGEQIFNTLKNTPGLKQQELKWSGLDDFLKNKKTATRDEVKEYLEKNSLDVSEIQRPRKMTAAEGEAELRLESKMLELDETIEKYKKANPEALVTNDMDFFSMQFRDIGLDNFAKIDKQSDYRTVKNLLNDVPEEKLFRNYMYDDKIVFNYLNRDGQPLSRIGPISVAETDRLLGEGFSRNQRFEFDPLELKKFYVSKELRDFNRTFDETKPKFDSTKYNEPGGEDYKELIFKLKGDGYPLEFDDYSLGKRKTKFPYKSPEVHFGTKNEFAHVRFKTRELDGQKTLAVEEMQSDLVTDMKSAYSGQVTDFPFKNNWYELVTKRLIRYAADNDFDAVAIPKARAIQDRYNLTKRVESLQIGSFDEKRKLIGIEGYDIDSGTLQISEQFTFADAEKKFGKENFEHILEKARNFTKDDFDEADTYVDLLDDFTFGGEGKDALYNKTIPSFIKKYGKKWNAKVYDDVWDGSQQAVVKRPGNPDGDLLKPGSSTYIPYTIIELTPEMKKSVQQDGQALFNIFGIGSGAAIGSNAILDSDRNNTISNLTEN